MAQDKLDSYRRKRDPANTPEPPGSAAGATSAGGAPRFVIQEHHATRQHWDLRLEHDGVAVSWALPNGIPQDPAENRLAVHTEDHPLEYLEFEGKIPKGQYGAGTMTVWDRGTFEVHKFDERKVEVTFHGERVQGRYGLFPLKPRGGAPARDSDDWMIHRMDPPQDPEREPMPESLVPMLARPGEVPRDERNWSFEVKWDGVRAVAYVKPGRLRLESRNLREITDSYPEVRGILLELGMREVVLDGEIVAFDDDGRPSFGRLQRRMHVTSQPAVRRLQKSTPVVYAIFDLLFLDGHSLLELPYEQRRERLEALELNGPAWRVPPAQPSAGTKLLQWTREQGLEGVVAKRLGSRYEPGRRSGTWIKVKNTRRQELVIGGWLPGEGRRAERIGALLMGVHENGGGLRYAGRVGTGFTERTLDELAARMKPLRRTTSPFEPGGPKLPRNTEFVEPQLVAEVEFTEWTEDGVMRAPSYKGLRDDKAAADVVRRARPRLAGWRGGPRGLPAGAVRRGRAAAGGPARRDHRRPPPQALELGQGAVPADRVHEGRPDRLLRAPRAGGGATPEGSRADAQALPERRRLPVLLREELAIAPPRLGQDRDRSAGSPTRSARTARRSCGSRTWPTSSSTRRCRWPRGPSSRRCSCSISTPARRPASSSAARSRSSCGACSSSSAARASSRPPARRACRSTCR